MIIFLSTLIFSLLLTPVVRWGMLKLHIMDIPDESRWSRRVVVQMGGIAIFSSFGLAVLLNVELTHEVGIILLGGGIIFLLGVSDDLFGTYTRVKFMIQCLVAIGVAYFGGVITILPHSGLNFLLTVLWIVGLTNSLNLLDNMDGLSGGVASIAALGLFGLSVMNGQTTTGLLGLALAGSCLGFLKYNFHPAKIFMGDCGAMFLGYTLATLAVFGGWQQSSSLTVSLLTPVLILCVPIFDTTLVTILRIRYRRSPWLGGKDHASHRLVSLLDGDERGAVLILYGVGIVAAGLALLSARLNSLMATILITVTFGVGLMWFGLKLAEVKCYQKNDRNSENEK